MPTVKQLQAETKMDNKTLAGEAGISLTSLRKLKANEPVQPFIVGRLCDALTKILKRPIKPESLDDVKML